MRYREDSLPPFWDFFQAARGSVVLENLLHKVVPPEPLTLRDLFEVVEEVRELLAIHHTLVPDQTELGLATAGRVRDHRDCPCWRDCRNVGVANLQPLFPLTAPLPGRIDPTLLREFRALIVSDFLNKSHDLAAPFDALLGIVRDLECEA